MAKVLIIGFGNFLMGDDGAGIHLIQKLADYKLPMPVELLDGGVNSFAALAELSGAEQGILIDAMIGGGKPGEIYRLTLEDINNQPCIGAISIHDFALLDSLKIFRKMGELPPVIVYGIEPAAIELGMELSPQVAAAVETVITKILEDIKSIK